MEREERRHYANDLRVAEEKYRSLVENVSEGILLLDTEGNFLEANKKMEGLLGFSEAELLTMNLTQVFPKEELERSRSTLEKVVQTGESDLANGWIIRKDDQRVPVNFVASKVEYGDRTIIQGIFRDLTEQPEAGTYPGSIWEKLTRRRPHEQKTKTGITRANSAAAPPLESCCKCRLPG